MGNIVKYQTLSSWISSLNTIQNKLSVSPYSEGTGASVGKQVKAQTVTNYLNSINSLRSNTYGAYGVYAISNPEKVNQETIIDDNIGTKIDITLRDLATLCANTLQNVPTVTGFSLQGTFISGFSRTSFSRETVTSFSDKSNNSNDSNDTDFSDACSKFTDFNEDSNHDFNFASNCTDFAENSDFNKNTSFSTDNPFNSHFNTPNSDCSNFEIDSFCGQGGGCSQDTDKAFCTDFYPDTCSDNSNCSVNSKCLNFSDMTNFNPNSVCTNTCNNSGTVNSLTSLFTGYAVRT